MDRTRGLTSNTLALILRQQGDAEGAKHAAFAKAAEIKAAAERNQAEMLKTGSCPCVAMKGATRRGFVRSLSRTASVFAFGQLVEGVPLPVQFVNVAKEAGLHAKTIYGGEKNNRYLLETTGCGAAFFDFDNDGWLDIFLGERHAVRIEIRRRARRR